MTNHFGKNLPTTYSEFYRVDEYGESVRVEAKFPRTTLEDATTRRLRDQVGMDEGDLRLLGVMRELLGSHGHWYDGMLVLVALDVAVMGRERREIEELRAQVNEWFDCELGAASAACDAA
ncbi:hypothetical protein [Roseobacter sinensis]|uniref:Uncharacterized protein n=1 Tax=Roseobacter sinensis TaxID=2931391 RepID=A0ABT3BEH3_9RHOB|nr:hypothetical protein [Roseobacter sp. WL0113]MCV3271952.1 hypothetical protein [Roseobacter sp. WL0113]